MMSYFRDNIQKMEPYTPGEQPRDGEFLKLNTNENPYPPPEPVLSAMRNAVNSSLRLYPDPVATSVRERAAEVLGVTPEMVIVGNGSDDILTIVMRSFANEGDAVVYLNPSYGLYSVLTDIQNASKSPVEYTADFRLPEDICRPYAKLTFICSPNNPTGTTVSADEVAQLAEKSPGIVAVDEAYVDFADSSCLELVHRFKNVVILRSFSKSFSLAGLRVGLGIASEHLIAGMMKVKDSYNIDRLSIAGAEAALANVQFMKSNTEKIKTDRRHLANKLEELGFDVLPSGANFVFARPPAHDEEGPTARTLYERLKDRKILVRYWDRPRLADGIRITVGTRQQLDTLLTAIADILSEQSC